MKKTGLIQKRKQKGYSQLQLAEKMCMDVTNYSRRESGKTKITKTEWEKLAHILETSLAEIYEKEEDYISGGSTQSVYIVPISLWEEKELLIQQLIEENRELKKNISILKNK